MQLYVFHILFIEKSSVHIYFTVLGALQAFYIMIISEYNIRSLTAHLPKFENNIY